MAKEKAVNYTDEMTAELVSAYRSEPTAQTVEAFSLKFDRSVRSIVAKLVREGVYKKPEYVGKTGQKPIFKEAIVQTIAGRLDLADNEADSLSKVNRSVLLKLQSALNPTGE